MNGNVLTGLSLVLAYGVFQQGGVWPRDWAICCCALGVLMLLYWLPQRQVHAPAPGRGVLIPVGLLMSVALLQLVPLPLAVINVLSPVRAASLAPLAPVVGPVQVASLSLIPTATLDHVSRLLVYFCLLLTVRDLCWRMRSRLWMVAVPILVVALLEAALGIFQVYSGQCHGRGARHVRQPQPLRRAARDCATARGDGRRWTLAPKALAVRDNGRVRRSRPVCWGDCQAS